MTGANATEAAIRLYVDQIKTYEKFQDVEDCLKQLLLAVVTPDYPSALTNKTADLADVSCNTIITHLWSSFGEITQQELDDNEKTMGVPICW
jgi:hypothetical protein